MEKNDFMNENIAPLCIAIGITILIISFVMLSFVMGAVADIVGLLFIVYGIIKGLDQPLNTKKCPNCGWEKRQNSVECPHCGHKF